MTSDASWLKDGVEAIEALTEKAMSVTPTVIDLPKERPGTYALVMPSKPGTPLKEAIEIKTAGPLWHNESLATVGDLVNFIKELSGDDEDNEKGTAYIGNSAVTYVYDFDDRRDRATTPLTTSKPWDWLVKADAGGISPMAQKDVIRTLRITFGGALPAGSNLLGIIRNIKFNANAAAEANIQHGNHSLGRQTMAQVTGVADIPEDVGFNVQVYENVPFSVAVQCALEINPFDQKFEIIPYPNQLAKALTETQEYIRRQFEDVTPAFLGEVRAGS